MNIFIILWVLSMASSAAESAASTGRAMLSANSNDSVEATTTQVNGEIILNWVKITAVPLGVFLLGACIWGIIQNTAATWGNSLNECGGVPPEADEVPAHHLTNIHRIADDLEEGQVESAHTPMEGGLATPQNPPDARNAACT